MAINPFVIAAAFVFSIIGLYFLTRIFSKTADKIMSERPFKDIVRFKEIRSLEGTASRSGRTFLAIGEDGKNYKLHYASSLEKADEIEQNVKTIPHIFPPLLGREGSYLLFEWIGGKALIKEEDPEVIRKLGRLVADVHNLTKTSQETPDGFFIKKLNAIPEGVLNELQKEKILSRYDELKNKSKVDVVLDLHDIHSGNFKIDDNQNVLLVDEGGLGHRVKGLGIAKPLINWFNAEQRKAFWEGYNEVHSGDYFDKDYESLVKIIESIRAIAFRVSKKQQPETWAKEITVLREICGI